MVFPSDFITTSDLFAGRRNSVSIPQRHPPGTGGNLPDRSGARPTGY